jgi:hypothetical protein
MRFIALAPILLILAACSDFEHPEEVVGTWVQDSLYGDAIIRRVDTLRLGGDGIALHSGSIAPTDRASSSIKPVVWAQGLKWAYRPRAEGHLLCLFAEEGHEQECHSVRIDSDSVIVVDGNSYRRLRSR